MAKYIWGSNPFPLPLWGLSMLLAAVLATVVYQQTAVTVGTPGVGGVDGASVTTFSGVILVTLGWILHYYNTIGHQVGLKFTNAFVPSPQAGVVGERSMMNTLEQGIVFLPLLWMHAAFVDVPTSVSMGWLYVITRFLYPLLYTFYGHFTVAVEIATSPNYAVIGYFAFGLLDACCDPTTTLIGRLTEMGLFVRFLAFFLQFPVIFFVLLVIPTGALTTVLNNKANPKGGAAYHEEPDSSEEEDEK